MTGLMQGKGLLKRIGGLVVVLSLYDLAASANSTFTHETNQELLPLVIQGSRNAYQSIRSGRGQVVALKTSFFPNGKIAQRTESKYDTAFSGNRLRGLGQTTYLENNSAPGQNSSGLHQPGHVERLHVSYDDIRFVAYFPDNVMARVRARAEKDSMLVALSYYGSMKDGHGVMDLSQYWQGVSADEYSIGGFEVVGRETIDGDECIVVETTKIRRSDGASTTHQIWVNPSKGYTIPRIMAWRTGGSLRRKVLVYEDHTKFRKCGDVWVLAHFTVDHYREEGPRMCHLEIAFGSDFEINVPVSDGELTLTLPPGTRILDEVIGMNYTMP